MKRITALFAGLMVVFATISPASAAQSTNLTAHVYIDQTAHIGDGIPTINDTAVMTGGFHIKTAWSWTSAVGSACSIYIDVRNTSNGYYEQFGYTYGYPPSSPNDFWISSGNVSQHWRIDTYFNGCLPSSSAYEHTQVWQWV